MEKINYTIINKDGKVVEDVTFDDYDNLADYMLEIADKWYEGVYDPDDQLKISTFDENNKLIYSDTASFEETNNVESEFQDIDFSNLPNIGDEDGGFGESVSFDSK
jgi:hypothetical protein